MPLARRDFLKLSALPLAAAAQSTAARPGVGDGSSHPPFPDRQVTTTTAGEVMTVRGRIRTHELGFALPHEHLFSIFGLEPEAAPEYDEAALAAAVLPRLREAKSLGCRAIFDCTAAYFGRHPRLLKMLSEKAGMHVVTNTGYYGAANERYIPPHARAEQAAQLAARWTREWRTGIGDTGIRPGFIKLGVGDGALSAVNQKLVEAAAITHLATGLTIAVHTANNPEAAAHQLRILRQTGVSPSAWIWTHAHAVEETGKLLEAAASGAWISLDGYRPDRHARFMQLVGALVEGGYLNQILLSHDANSYPRRGASPGSSYVELMRRLLPALRESGLRPAEIRALTVVNPARAFTVSIRRH